MKQVNKEAYSFGSYCDLDRWGSYHYQIREVLRNNPSTVLEVGTGDGVLKNYLVANTSVIYKNLDIAEDLNPDILGSVEDIPVSENSFDLVCAFEILEHLPFDKFETCLSELKRVSRGDVVISLPHFGPPVKFLLKIPFLPQIKFAFKMPYFRRHIFNGQHYWEIGKKGYSISKIRYIIRKHFILVDEFVPFENQYHHFFILKK